MKDHFEIDLKKRLNEKKELPDSVRESLDEAYSIIRAKSKKKKGIIIWNRVAIAACALLVSVGVLTHKQVMANLNDFFHFGDKGIDQAVHEGYVQEADSIATDQGIKIKLSRHFSDANKVGMSFMLEFEDPSILKNAEEVSMDYRLKNGDGEYIVEFIPDTKPLKGSHYDLSISEQQNPLFDTESRKIQYDVLVSSNNGEIPELKDAVIEVESVNVFNDARIKKTNGNWELKVGNQKNNTSDGIVRYITKEPSSIIQVSKADAYPTSLNLTFALKGKYENENTFANNMKIIDEKGNEYPATNFSFIFDGEKTVISTNFPFSSYHYSNTLKLIVTGVGEVDLVQEKRNELTQ
ncbi:DUF4179 domain-containing protein [Rossellomorea aquimaris]|uniref:DUF4179 domain-containing protein n=1 Tax=Rossellomorea aquimaris TaxID=189382 RepID=UPI001CD6F6BE|nr:DUF4179 domain-containing protein [Rossellomorea aquimaris]MCA1057521.1 DUF4179 domain-containing protein [Rossellomorea aquimaris]